MLRDFQLMGWRGWEGERRDREEVIELEEKIEEAESMGKQSVFGPEMVGVDYLPQKETAKVETEKSSVECWEFVAHEKLHSFAPTC